MTVQTWNGAPESEVKPTADGELVRTWRTTKTAPVVPERQAPSWFRPFASIRISDVMSWPDVAATFADCYRPEPLPEDLEAKVAALENEPGDVSTRVVKALRLVQGGLRYQAISIGEGGFVPRPLKQIWSSRTGDCKDASRLLVAILRRIGVDATPALVNTARSRSLQDEAPSLVAFNHCVVGLTLNGSRYWLDPTLFPQGGTLDLLCQSRHGWALTLRLGADLEPMGEDLLSDSFHISQVYVLPYGLSEPGELTMTSTLFGWRADLVRRRLANGQDVFKRARAERHAQWFESASEIEPLRITDDLEANRIELVEKVKLGRVWYLQPDGRAAFTPPDDFFSANIAAVPSEGRRSPIRLGPLLRATSTVEFTRLCPRRRRRGTSASKRRACTRPPN